GGGGAGAAGGAGQAAGGGGNADLLRRLAEQQARQAHNQRDHHQQGSKRAVTAMLVGLGTMIGALLLLITLVVVIFGTSASATAGSGAWGYPTGSPVPKVYWPIYVTAADHYEVNPYVLAAIHNQESRFSTYPGVRSGWNSIDCCGGPMQFHRDTWPGHRDAFRPIDDMRPSDYPLDRRQLPSCAFANTQATGCIYDDFDAIAAAAHKLKGDGADDKVLSTGTHDAVCAYIGACSEVDQCNAGSINRYCEVIPNAVAWERAGAIAGPIGAAVGTVTIVPGRRAVIMPNGLAKAPADAPLAVKKMIAAGNKIHGLRYELRHYDTHIDNETYDCSSSTSHVLWAGGKFGEQPWCSAMFPSYGKPGPGRWVTVHTRGPCGPTGHVFMVIAGLRYDTSPAGDTSVNAGKFGPRWRTERGDAGDFIQRHPEGL
ncbi:hypothetical protein VSS74_24595, partial [Conexibacter stalactiti]